MLNNDRPITISVANSRYAIHFIIQEYTIQDFYARLSVPSRGTETHKEYMAKGKRDQDNLKDVGAFVGGVLRNGVRKNGNIVSRDLITLDMDHIGAGKTNDILRRLDSLGCSYAVYSTRKHAPEAPRLRAVFPVDLSLSADEYEPGARKLAEMIDPSMVIFDRTTFQPVRIMYWPSCSSDSEYIFKQADKPLLSKQGLLDAYPNWQAVESWPRCPDESQIHISSAKAEDPTNKTGVVGAFCKVYNIYSAIEAFLPEVYTQVDNQNDRMTYSKGSTSGGAVIYQNGTFLYSNHATDPAGGKLCNAFDLVRLHLFNHLDDEADLKTPIAKLPSFVEMRKLALKDAKVKDMLNQEKMGQVAEDFKLEDGENSLDWMRDLDMNGQGAIEKTLKNYKLIIQNHPDLKGIARLNLFSGRIDVCRETPWKRPTDSKIWCDTDTTNLRIFLEKLCGKSSKNDMNDAIEACASLDAYHPVKEYLENISWDGVKRLDTMLIDYMGAEISEYTKAVTRKAFVAAVARIMQPGIKYDTMLVLIGGQGRYKSSLFAKMGGEWFSDSLKTFDGKEAMETIQGTWINEVSEMQAMQKSEVNAVKAFLSKQTDYFRAAYGRHVSERPRQCIFFGTSNERDVLTDTTGGRRFWAVDIDMQERSKNVFVDLPFERDLLWAEAVVYWRLGEPLHLAKNLEETAKEVQEAHRERHPWEGIIEHFLEKDVPADWQEWDLQRRLMYLNGQSSGEIRLVKRTRVCAVEIWCEALGKNKADMTKRNTREINQILESFSNWKSVDGARNVGDAYGKQRCFERQHSA